MSTLVIEKLGSTVGAAVHGVDRDRVQQDSTLPAACMEALEEHGVLIFRELHIDDETQIAFSKQLDDVGKAEPADPPSIYIVSLDPAKSRTAAYTMGTFHWHIDGAQDDIPTKATMLSAHMVATTGGETEFASTYAAYDDLSTSEKEECDGLHVVHSFEASQRLVHPDPSPEEVARWR
jgi:alpha-ketoglutarate-dependent taurine dioxygenase